MLVGNPESEACIEVTLAGPRLELMRDTLFALCGGDFGAAIAGRAVPTARPVFVRAGHQLDLGACKRGCRAYLAVAGGFAVPRVMESRSTYLRGGFGGFEGRALKRGDVLPIGEGSQPEPYPALRLRAKDSDAFVSTRWSIGASAAFQAHDHHRIRFVPGRHWEQLTEESRLRFSATEFRIGSDSDRMGYRLDGATLERAQQTEIMPEGVTFGTIQVPPDGRLIVLMANRQTTGGYPRVGEVASVDLPLLAQLPPGDTLRFEAITLEESQALYLKRERELDIMREALQLRMRT
jgi:antagonist of KipI